MNLEFFSIKKRLSFLMFLQYFVLGATLPILSLYFRNTLNFSSFQVGVILSSSAFASITAPFIVSFIADKKISSVVLLSICHFIAGVLILILSVNKNFSNILIVYTFYILTIGPTNALVNSISFHITENDRAKFGNLRVWGTIGWVVVAWIISGFKTKSDNLIIAFYVAALSSFLMGFYALSFKLKSKNISKSNFKLKHLKTIMNKQFLLIVCLSIVIVIVDKYYYFGTAPYLDYLGINKLNILPLMSLGQVVEIFTMFFLAFFLKKLGLKRVLLIGISGEILRFGIFAFFENKYAIIPGLLMHGFAYAFYFTASYIYIDSCTDKNNRTSIHQLYAMVTSGFGSLLGNLIAGIFMDFSLKFFTYRLFWFLPLGLSLLVFVFVLIFFDRKNKVV